VKRKQAAISIFRAEICGPSRCVKSLRQVNGHQNELIYHLGCLTESPAIRIQDFYTFKVHWTFVWPVWCRARPRMGTKHCVLPNVRYCVSAALRSHAQLLIPIAEAFIASCPSASPASSSVEILLLWRVLAVATLFKHSVHSIIKQTPRNDTGFRPRSASVAD